MMGNSKTMFMHNLKQQQWYNYGKERHLKNEEKKQVLQLFEEKQFRNSISFCSFHRTKLLYFNISLRDILRIFLTLQNFQPNILIKQILIKKRI